MFTIKCFDSRHVIYTCQVENYAHAIATAHLFAETYGDGCRANIYKPGESTHFYEVRGNMDISNRIFT